MLSHVSATIDVVIHCVNVVKLLLLVAGDIEVNPGPVHPGLLKAILKDLHSVREKYESLGDKLEVPLEQINAYKQIYKGDSDRVFAEVINVWLNSHDEDYAELFVNEKKEVDTFMTSSYSKEDYINALCQALKSIEEVELAECLQRKYECQRRLLQSLLQDLREVEEKYATVGVGLEVSLTQIHQLECKYQDNKSKIFAEVLHCWLDNYSQENYIQDLCGVLVAVNEATVAERIRAKYSTNSDDTSSVDTALVDYSTPHHKTDESLAVSEGKPEIQSQKSMTEAEPDFNGAELEASHVNKKDTNSVDGSPQAIQEEAFKVEGTPQQYKQHVGLNVSYPSAVPPEKLKNLVQTMTDEGDSQYPLNSIKWKHLIWVPSFQPDDISKTVHATIAIHFGIIPANSAKTIHTIENGVQHFLCEALDNKYKVVIESTT